MSVVISLLSVAWMFCPMFVSGWIPLHAAAEAGHAQVTDWLLSKGANVELCTDTDYNALHLAASGGHMEVCQKLVKAGSPLDQITDAGLYGAPLHYAAGKVNRCGICCSMWLYKLFGICLGVL